MIAERKPAVLNACVCGQHVNATGMKNHLRGEPHRCKMTKRTAEKRQHHYTLNEMHEKRVAQLTAAGFGRHFTMVEAQVHGWERETRVTTLSKIWHTSLEMMKVLTNYASTEDDIPENTMHAALVFVEVYHTDVVQILISLINRELLGCDTQNATFDWVTEASLILILKANGVSSPARTLANLMPHMLEAALETLR